MPLYCRWRILAAEDAMIDSQRESEGSRGEVERKREKNGVWVMCVCGCAERATSGDPEVFDIKGEDE